MATIDQAPHLTAATLNAIMAKTVGNASQNELHTILDALSRVSTADNPGTFPIDSQLP
jgi:hypothetical protein